MSKGPEIENQGDSNPSNEAHARQIMEQLHAALYETLLLRKPGPSELDASVALALEKRLTVTAIIERYLRSKGFAGVHHLFFDRYVDRSKARFTNDVSQYGETESLLKRMVNRAAKHRIIVDVGARGRERSNSYDLLRHFGWKGLLIEANPNLIEQIREQFADLDVQLVSSAVSDRTGTHNFYLGIHDGISSLRREQTSKWGPIAGSVPVEVRRLADILQSNSIPPDFDVLSLDIEGEDIKVVNDVVQNGGYTPRWIILEASYNFRTKSLADIPVCGEIRMRYDLVDQTKSNLVLELR